MRRDSLLRFGQTPSLTRFFVEETQGRSGTRIQRRFAFGPGSSRRPTFLNASSRQGLQSKPLPRNSWAMYSL